MPSSPAVQALSSNLIFAKRSLRKSSKLTARALNQIGTACDCEIVQKAGVKHVYLSDQRVKTAQAMALIEQANQLMCEVHCDLMEIADKNGLTIPSDLEIVAMGGGGR